MCAEFRRVDLSSLVALCCFRCGRRVHYFMFHPLSVSEKKGNIVLAAGADATGAD